MRSSDLMPARRRATTLVADHAAAAARPCVPEEAPLGRPGEAPTCRAVQAMAAELARQGAAIKELVITVIELSEDLKQARAAIDRKRGRRRRPSGLITLDEAAFRTGYSSETIRQWAGDHEIDAIRDGGQWLVGPLSVAARAARKS